MKMTVWTAQNVCREFLCMGNRNKGLSYHFAYPYDCEYLRSEDYIMCRTKHEAEEHIRKWHGELSMYKFPYKPHVERYWRCRPVKMIVSWEPVKGTKKEEDNGK